MSKETLGMTLTVLTTLENKIPNKAGFFKKRP